MLVNQMIEYLESLKADGISVEIYFQWHSPELKAALQKMQYKGTGACASLSYQWIRRQLSQGVLATPSQPVFKTLSTTELTKIAKDQVTHGRNSPMNFEIKEKGFEPSGYRAIITAEDGLICGLIGEGRFAEFTNGASSDRNISDVLWWVEGTVDAAYNVENLVRNEVGGSNPEKFDDLANQFPDFFGVLVLRGSSSGHAVALRHDPWTGLVHFFDPNFGHFRFPSWQVFREKLKPLWRYGYMDPAHPEPVFPPVCRFQNYFLIQYRKKPLSHESILAKKWFSIRGPEGSTDSQIALLQSLNVPTHALH